MAITCPSWGSTCPLWLASNQYGQDLKARAHKSEFAASTSRIFQLRNLKSPEISETFSRNFSLFPNMLHYLQTSEMPSRGVWPQQRQLVALRISPSQVVDVGVKKPQQHPPAIVQSLSHSEYSISYIFFRVSKGAARTLTQTGLKLRSRRHFTWGFLEHSNKNFRSCTLAVHN